MLKSERLSKCKRKSFIPKIPRKKFWAPIGTYNVKNVRRGSGENLNDAALEEKQNLVELGKWGCLRIFLPL